jgi:hypothetical protein
LTEETESAPSVHGSLPVEREEPMKRKSRDEKADELRAEYDLGELLKFVDDPVFIGYATGPVSG